jgi:HEPN domain-containing protein
MSASVRGSSHHFGRNSFSTGTIARVEKALKGLYYEKRQQIPPKSHSLQYLLNEIGIKPPPSHGKFIIKLSEASIPTRYPEDLEKMKKDFTPEAVGSILMKAKEVVQWIKKQL